MALHGTAMPIFAKDYPKPFFHVIFRRALFAARFVGAGLAPPGVKGLKISKYQTSLTSPTKSHSSATRPVGVFFTNDAKIVRFRWRARVTCPQLDPVMQRITRNRQRFKPLGA
jgi:hypothetical protein